VLLSGDIGNRLFDRFKAACPGRFLNCGVAEANMMGVAAGIAVNGLRPIVYTIAPFTTTRCLEQIRVDACYHAAPVIIVGTGAGLSYAALGPTHHSCEDIAILRPLPGISIICPCDAVELRLALAAALELDGPAYLRIGKKGEPLVHRHPPDFRIGRAISLREGRDVCIVATGNIMPVAIEAAVRLEAEGISAGVESFHTVKPLDTERLEALFRHHAVVATVEEHGRIGGLGSAVAEFRAGRREDGGRLVSFGVDDVFLHRVGSQDYARRAFGLTPERIAEEIRCALRAC
jgi:transketolase